MRKLGLLLAPLVLGVSVLTFQLGVPAVSAADLSSDEAQDLYGCLHEVGATIRANGGGLVFAFRCSQGQRTGNFYVMNNAWHADNGGGVMTCATFSRYDSNKSYTGQALNGEPICSYI